MSMIRKYIWTIETIRSYKKISLEQLSDRYAANESVSGGSPLNRQTLFRWRNDIAEMFGIAIECKHELFYIANPEVLDQSGLTQWLLNTYSTLNSLENSLRVKDRILTEPIPSSELFLNDIIEALKQNRLVRFTYTKFVDGVPNVCTVRPYCVKLFMQRWYLLGYCEERKGLRTYGLDRMTDFSTTDEKFSLPNDFDAEAYFSTHFGISTETYIKCETVTFKAYNPHNCYLRALPLHSSQEEVEKGDGYSVFQVRLRPNYEFYWRLLGMGDKVQILSPEGVRREMMMMIKRIGSLYQEE